MISVILFCLLTFSIICLIILISVYLFGKELTVQAKEGYPCLTFIGNKLLNAPKETMETLQRMKQKNDIP